MVEFLSEINWSPSWISLKTGVAATIFAFFLGVFCARKIMKLKPGARAVLDGILTMPLVLPPTVAGFCLLLLFSLKRPFGSFLLDNFDIKASSDMDRMCDRSFCDRVSTDVSKCQGGL